MSSSINCYDNYSTDSYQVSPTWMVSFVRFEDKDFYNYSNKSVKEQLKKPINTITPPLVVVNDCVNLNVSQSKGSYSHSCSMTLLSGEVNYLSAITPGDYFTVNITGFESKIDELYDRAMNLKSINRYGDGFKGLFRVQSIHQSLQMAPNGAKRLVYQVTGHAFNEYDNVIYFNPYLVSQGEKDNNIFFLTSISDKWNSLIKDKGYNSVQYVIRSLYSAFVGNGFNPDIANKQLNLKDGIKRTENNLYRIPEQIASLMGIPSAKFAADLTNVYEGVQQYPKRKKTDPDYKKLNPDFKDVGGRVFVSSEVMMGHSYNKPEYWNQIKVWNIMNQYLNPLVNEMYATFKVSPELNKNGESLVLPNLVYREKPFTTSNFKKKVPKPRTHTYFHSLPRWVLPAEATIQYSVGKDDTSRINFVQVFGQLQSQTNTHDIDYQIAAGNYQVDRGDIIRSGLRPYIATSNFDYVNSNTKSFYDSVYWSKLVSNWVMGSHLKLSGTLQVVGIEKPIAVGDNLEFEGKLFHIEGFTHSCSFEGGRKRFLTSIQVSNGLDLQEDSKVKPYAETTHENSKSYANTFKRKGSNESLVPGMTDSQDNLRGNRQDAEKVESVKSKINPIKKGRK